ncbi:GNAT family N-acetyltransferase [Streptomyces albidus (ex Kaewkla and Franco 2022)]|uniref:GNAT family N-acetyltransferase n=1 Tax=Streptomyces albidus (ex Kaewkla and Franco 2022) TaxID=722709 RepID=UPI0015EE5063|nr:GNAT family N-acetyltransferase [Streptomyces albidus (ex Kaewkla and Franco 2022)]
MPLTFEMDPSITHELSDGLCVLWRDVTNASGAVGFVPPVTVEDVRHDLLSHLAAVDDGRTRMMIGRDEQGEIVAAAFLSFNTHRLKRHWCSVYTVMVQPALQGKGYGRDLMSEVEKEARGMEGITALKLTCRGGLGLERFYLGCGYREVGRLPGAIEVAEGDLRDDVIFWLALA